MTEKKYSNNNEDAANAILGLALEKRPKAEKCPDSEDLASWYDNSLSEKERSRIADHVSFCDDCYAIWIEMADILIETDTAEDATAETTQSPPGFVGQMKAWITSFFGRPWAWGAGLSTAVAALLAVFIVLPSLRLSGLDTSINNGLNNLSAKPYPSMISLPKLTTADFSIKSFPLPGHQDTPDTAKPSLKWRPSSDAEQTLAHGIREALGKAAVLGSEDRQFMEMLPKTPGNLPAPEEKTLNMVGRWLVLMSRSCADEHVAKEFWAEQNKNLKALKRGFAQTKNPSEIGSIFLSWNVPSSRHELCNGSEAVLKKVFPTPDS